MRTIVYSNQKGGVGKSTSCINFAAILGSEGYKVLVIDMDPQGNTTSGLGIEEYKGMKTIYECLVDELPLNQAILQTPFKNVDLVPATITLANAEIEIAAVIGRESLLKESIHNHKLDYDFILIDLPPNLGLLTINGLVAAKEIIIPIDVSIFAMSGVSQLLKVIKTVKKKLNPEIEILGALLTKVDGRTNLSKEIHADLQEYFGEKMFKSVIHQSVRIAEAQKDQKPITYFDPRCRGAEEYIQAVREVLKRE